MTNKKLMKHMRYMMAGFIVMLSLLTLIQLANGAEGNRAILFGINSLGTIEGPCTVENKLDAKPVCPPNDPWLTMQILEGGNIGNFKIMVDNGYSGDVIISIANKWVDNEWFHPPKEGDIIVDELENTKLGDFVHCPNSGSTNTGYLYICGYPRFVVSPTAERKLYPTYIKISFTIDGQRTTIPVLAWVELTRPPCGNTPKGNNILFHYSKNLNIIFDTVTRCGDTSANYYISNEWSPLPDNYKSIKFYDIETTATYDNYITIKIIYSDSEISNIDENTIRMLHYENKNWVDITNSLDTNSNTVTGRTTVLSPYAIVGIDSEDIIEEDGQSLDTFLLMMLSICLMIVSILKLKR